MFTAPATLKIDDGSSVGDNVAESDGEANTGRVEHVGRQDGAFDAIGFRESIVDALEGILSIKF